VRPRTFILVTGLAFIVAAGVSAWAWGQIPDGARVPIHWGVNGEANGWAPKWVALSIVPGMILVLGAVFAAIPLIDPRRPHLLRSSRAYLWIAGTAIVVLVVVHIASVAMALGARLDIGRVVGVVIGVMFCVIGNFLGKTRSNWFMGIRTPWTLSSERSWARTHRLAGYLFVAAGLLVLALSFLASAVIVVWGLLVAALLASLIPIVYSYFAWRDDPDRHPFGG